MADRCHTPSQPQVRKEFGKTKIYIPSQEGLAAATPEEAAAAAQRLKQLQVRAVGWAGRRALHRPAGVCCGVQRGGMRQYCSGHLCGHAGCAVVFGGAAGWHCL